jgi:hypothetical protein
MEPRYRQFHLDWAISLQHLHTVVPTPREMTEVMIAQKPRHQSGMTKDESQNIFLTLNVQSEMQHR